jgi:hypothetical protein
MSRIHDAAHTGHSAAADACASGPPGYPPDAAHWLREVVGAGPGRVVLDPGAGTGAFTP